MGRYVHVYTCQVKTGKGIKEISDTHTHYGMLPQVRERKSRKETLQRSFPQKKIERRCFFRGDWQKGNENEVNFFLVVDLFGIFGEDDPLVIAPSEPDAPSKHLPGGCGRSLCDEREREKGREAHKTCKHLYIYTLVVLIGVLNILSTYNLVVLWKFRSPKFYNYMYNF